MTAVAEEAEAILKPYPAENMASIAPRTVVNDPANDGPECLEPAVT